MAYTQDQLTTLERAIASGRLEVQHNNRKIRYQSLSEMITLRDHMRGELALNTRDSRTRGGFVRFTVGKGL